jgi:hypothetical protein
MGWNHRQVVCLLKRGVGVIIWGAHHATDVPQLRPVPPATGPGRRKRPRPAKSSWDGCVGNSQILRGFIVKAEPFDGAEIWNMQSSSGPCGKMRACHAVRWGFASTHEKTASR